MNRLEKLLKLVEAKRPELYATLIADPENIDEEAVFEAVADIVAESQKKPDPDPKTPPAATLDKDAIATLIGEALDGKFEGVLEKMAQTNAMGMADRLLSESELPKLAQKRVRYQLDHEDKVDEVKIREAIKAEQDYLQVHTSWAGPGSTAGAETVIEGVKVHIDERDKWDAAFAGLFAEADQEITLDGGKKFRMPRYQSIREAYVDFTGDVDVTGEVRNAPRISEAAAAIASTTWAAALGDHLHKAMQREYRMAPFDQWKTISDVVPVKDFQSNYRSQLGGFSALPSVAEGGSYVGATAQPSEDAPYYAVTKYGYTQVVNLETIVNDDVGAVRRIPRKLARAAARTLNTNVWNPVLTNADVTWEAVALCAAGHGANIDTDALTPASLIAGRTVMMKQAEADSSERLNIPPSFLACSVDLENTAFEICMSPAKAILASSLTDTNAAAGTPTTGTISAENNNILNFIRNQNIIPLVVPHWTATTKWFLLADKKDVPMLEVGFLGGREEPELFTQDMPNVGSMFTNDQLTYKVRHIYGVVALDYRGFYFGNV